MHKYSTMKIQELLESALHEGVNDPAIFKVVFVIGGPGSGKSFVSDMLGLKALGFVTINSDEALSYLMTKHGLSLKMPPEEEPQRNIVRTRAKELTAGKMGGVLSGRLGIVIDGTGEDYEKIAGVYRNLQEIGYEAFLVVVYADLETALRRNAERPRSVPEEIVKKKWYGVQRNMDSFLATFDNNIVIDNNRGVAELKPQAADAYRKISAWSKRSPSSPAAKEWIKSQSGPSAK